MPIRPAGQSAGHQQPGFGEDLEAEARERATLASSRQNVDCLNMRRQSPHKVKGDFQTSAKRERCLLLFLDEEIVEGEAGEGWPGAEHVPQRIQYFSQRGAVTRVTAAFGG